MKENKTNIIFFFDNFSLLKLVIKKINNIEIINAELKFIDENI